MSEGAAGLLDDSERKAGSEQGKSSPMRGDRGVALVARSFASLQSKVRNLFALGVVALLGGGFLTWYYAGLAGTREEVKQPERDVLQAESRLPPLGPAPRPPPTREVVRTALVDEDSPEALALLAGPVEPEPRGYAPPSLPGPVVDPSLQRRLESKVLLRGEGHFTGDTEAAGGGSLPERSGGQGAMASVGEGSGSARLSSEAAGLAAMLEPTRTAAVAAGLLPDRRWLLPKGSSIDCTLETAIDSTLPGMTSCVLASDVWGADGQVVLMERGTKLVGETRGGARQGSKRLFVLWNEARTPSGVAVDLASPGTDALGRAGVTGDVDTQFGARFGAAILISLLDAAAAAIVAAQGEGGNNVIVSTRGAQDVVSEVVRQSMDIAPVISVPQGERVAVTVARDVDFSRVYSLARK
jgi:type IV secretion system protein VirB10